MDRIVWSDPQITRSLNDRFISVRVDVLDDGNEWVSDAGITTVPTMVTSTPQGDPILVIEGATSANILKRMLQASLKAYGSPVE